MSTDRQQYSFLNQAELMAKFAERHGFYVTKTYEDPAKSGLSFRKRVGLQMLIKDVVSGLAAYKAILVYDVSRWGRFQDIDEAAHTNFSVNQPESQCTIARSHSRMILAYQTSS
jgi:DNA invertase Pin-like site-specific DNA recombinase